ncbi:MAG: lipocalin family protein [Gilvibacter sp.]
MKKAAILLLCLSFVSCGPKVVRESKKVIKGDWKLSDISYSQSGNFNVMLLNDASKDCFQGSTWKFIPNNNTGTYSINSSDCPTGDRYFIFTIQEIDAQTGLYDFLLKPTNAKGKSETNKGFRLKLSALSDSAMQWQQTIILEGDPFTISMNFTKS